MSVKTEVLSCLEQNRGKDISGEALAQQLGVSRAAVWKAINSLKQQGYSIESVTNRGYRLSESSDILSEEGIKPCLLGDASSAEVVVFDEIDSTNMEAKRRAANGDKNPLIIAADQQSMGRGRFGRSFYSPQGCGIYMSMLIHPSKEQLAHATMFTTAAAVAVCRAISSVSSVDAKIKWVNDIYVNGRKVCGILSEAVFDMENGVIGSIVVGIGINFKNGGELPAEIADIAGAVFGDTPPTSRNELTAKVANEFFDILKNIEKRDFLNEYRERSMLLGEEIVYSRGDEKYAAVAEAIDDDGALVVVFKDGKREALRSGEVSVRPKSMAASLPLPSGNV